MSSIGTSKGILEIGKFAFYVSIPIDLMYTLTNNSENMKKLVQKALRELMVNNKDRENKEIKSEVRQGSSKILGL
ncbi:hypothetical protein AAG906_016606 [Vitis piasezkii]